MSLFPFATDEEIALVTPPPLFVSMSLILLLGGSLVGL